MHTYQDEIEFGIKNGIINGAVISAGTIRESLVEKAFGYANISSKTKMRLDTVIDLASLTKVLATTTALAICYDDGLIDFDVPFTRYLPQYIAPLKEPVTVRDLAMHISGFGQQNHYDAPEGLEIRRKMLSIPPPIPSAS